MRPRLVIRLSSTPEEPPRWVTVDSEGHVEGPTVSGDLAQAAESAGGRHVVALASGPDVLLTPTRIPTQAKKRLAKAVPYALEDQLAEDVELLHFAIGERDAAQRLWVAVIAESLLNHWLDAFDNAGIEVDQIYPEQLALPWAAGQWTLLAENERFLLRTDKHAGIAGDTENLGDLLLALVEDTEAETAPEVVAVYDCTDAGLDLPELGVPVERRDSVGDATAVLATSLEERNALPLLTGEYAKSSDLQVHFRRWRAAAALAVAWVLLSTAHAYYQQWQLERTDAQLQRQIDETFRQAFPNTETVVDPRQQMESRLAALKSGGDSAEGGLLPLLVRVGPILTEGDSVRLTALSYRGGDLDVELYADNLQHIDQLKQKLGGLSGVSVEVRSAKAEGDRVQGRLRIQVTS